jgi:transcriptional regulator NrdR family protein
MSQKCRACGGPAAVRDSRAIDKNATRRRYRCLKPSCGERWTTIEMIIADGVYYRAMVQQLQASAKTTSALLQIRALINKVVGE